MKIPLKFSLVSIFILCAIGLWLAWSAYDFLNTPPSQKGEEIMFDVRPGAHLPEIANSLAQKGLITDARKFSMLARFKNYGSRLQAGRFVLNSGWKPKRVLETLVNGQPVMFRVTVPEGLTWWQTGRLLADAGFVRFKDFEDAISDPAFLRHYGIPFSTAEGFLMPDTYLLKKPDLRLPPQEKLSAAEEAKARDEMWKAQSRAVAGRMVDNFWRKASPFWPGQNGASDNANALRRPPREYLKKIATLASIVEKETGQDFERPRVAGVYANRLQKNMPLQADPTVIYGLGPDFAGPLRRSDLDNAQNPYNTYQNHGLPPGPISSFGLAALKAAINPEKHDYLYFVAKTDGGEHTFSRTLEDHNQAVREYRRRKSER